MQFCYDAPRVLGFLGEIEWAGLLAQQRVVELDEAELGHRLAGLVIGVVSARRGRFLEAPLDVVAGVFGGEVQPHDQAPGG